MRKVLVLLLGISCSAHADFGKVGTAGLQFLKVGVGARAMGMGRACNAVCDDASSLFWNPAGAAQIGKNDALFSHTEYFAGISHEAFGYVHDLGNAGNVGAFFSMLGSGEMDVTTIEQYEGTGEKFSYNSFQVGLHYSRFFTDRFSLGANLKFVREDYGVQDVNSSDILVQCPAMDIGTFYHTGYKSLRIGISILHFGADATPSGEYFNYENDRISPKDTFDFDPYPLPMLLRFGGAMEVWETKDAKVTVAVDAIHPNDNVERISVGSECVLKDMFFLRGGYELRKDDGGGLACGCGFLIKGVAVDYSYSDRGYLDIVHRVTLGLGL
jgi:hypothetical protein